MSTTAISTGVLAVGTTLVFTGHTYVNSIQLFADGTNAAVVNVYDNTSATGKIVAKLAVPATGVAASIVFCKPIRCDIGLTVEVTGTGGTAIVAHSAT